MITLCMLEKLEVEIFPSTLWWDLLGLFVLGGLIDEVLSDLMLLTRQAPNDVLITPFLSLRFFPCKNTVSSWVIVAFKELLT